MENWIDIKKSPEHIKREKYKAQQLKKTQWWKNQVARGLCYYCREKFLPADLTMDHIVPLVRGGKSIKGNVVPCCKNCNNKKKYLTPVEIKFKGLHLNK